MTAGSTQEPPVQNLPRGAAERLDRLTAPSRRQSTPSTSSSSALSRRGSSTSPLTPSRPNAPAQAAQLDRFCHHHCRYCRSGSQTATVDGRLQWFDATAWRQDIDVKHRRAVPRWPRYRLKSPRWTIPYQNVGVWRGGRPTRRVGDGSALVENSTAKRYTISSVWRVTQTTTSSAQRHIAEQSVNAI